MIADDLGDHGDKNRQKNQCQWEARYTVMGASLPRVEPSDDASSESSYHQSVGKGYDINSRNISVGLRKPIWQGGPRIRHCEAPFVLEIPTLGTYFSFDFSLLVWL